MLARRKCLSILVHIRSVTFEISPKDHIYRTQVALEFIAVFVKKI
jgi:hypothetical protein